MTTLPSGSDEFDVAGFRQAVEMHWQHHGNCRHLLWSIQKPDGKEEWQIEVAPIYQEVLGSKDDGMKVWTGFEFNLSGFFGEPGVFALGFGAASYCIDCCPTPFIGVRGRYHGQPFMMKLHLEPIADSDPVEIIDTLKGEVRAIQESQE
jgi:hypothetical protein